MNNIDNLEELLEKEIRVQSSIKAAHKAYIDSIQKDLETEVRVQNSIQEAFNAYKTIEGTEESPIAANITIGRNRKPLWIYSSVAASILLLVAGSWQYDSIANENAGQFGLELVTSTHGPKSDITTLIEGGRYDDALKMIDDALTQPFKEELYSGEALIMAQKDFENTQNDLKLQKASVLLLQGKKSEAKEILKNMNTENANKILDKLFFLW